MIVLDLPMPPSANLIWRTARGRTYRSPDYAAWREQAGWLVKGCKPVAGPVRVEIAVSQKARGDIDNRIKPVLDVLVAGGLIAGDDKKTVRSVYAYWSPDVGLEGIRVAVASASEQEPSAEGQRELPIPT
jgi:Holliday junction resolvase RusA-like endonuclease